LVFFGKCAATAISYGSGRLHTGGNPMAALSAVIDAYLASREIDRATLSRLAFWEEELGECELGDITADDVDAAVVRLAERGRLRPIRGQPTEQARRPLSGATINRYLSQLGTIYRHARRLRLLPRAHVPPPRASSAPQSRLTRNAICAPRKWSALSRSPACLMRDGASCPP